MNILKENLRAAREHAIDFLRWMILAVITGLLVGGVGILFVKGLGLANAFRGEHPEMILGLPIAGLALVRLYKISNYENDKGTNMVISTLHAETQIPFRMAPLIFMSALFLAVPSLASSVGVLVPVGILVTLGVGRILYKKGWI